MQPPKVSIKVVGILSPGDMGHAVGRELKRHGFDVVASLENRSDRTIALAERAGIRNVGGLDQLTQSSDVILSILVPDAAVATARQLARFVARSESRPLYVDCNAISPQNVKVVADVFADAGCGECFLDGSIIGFPPGTAAPPRLYVSGPHANRLEALDGAGIEIHQAGPNIGQASGLKMCYAALTKGSFALQYALTIAGQRMGLLEPLLHELRHSQPQAYDTMAQQLPRLPAKSHRWVGEMHEIAATFEDCQVPAGFHQAAADIFRHISQSSLGQETPETIDATRTLQETIEMLSR